MPKKTVGWLAVSLWLCGLLLAALGATDGGQAESFAAPAFEKLWNITDKPVADGAASRSFLWGPEGFATRTERYDNSPDGQRLVQYFDKGRMELTNPQADPNNPWYVSSGLLVRDLAAGLVQVGDNQVQIFDPAQVPVAGDSLREANKDAPTYADFFNEVLGRGTTGKVGNIIRDTVRAGGRKGMRDPKAEPALKYAYYVPQSNHNIAAPFWEYFQQRGLVYPPNGGTATASLFNWQFLMGYPVTEPYWTTVNVEGKDLETLVQLFERRVLTYTPTNPDAYKVEMGNVGRHYYQWRYGPAPVVVQDTSVPQSIGGTVSPQFGGVFTVFHFTATDYRPGEAVNFSLTQPNGNVLESRRPVRANQAGTVALSLSASSFVAKENNGRGIYSLSLFGEQTKRPVTIYLRIVEVAPITPTTPYTVERSVPPSVNAIPEPAVGHAYSDFSALLKGIYLKDFAQDKISVWINDPFGAVFAVPASLLEFVDETPEGAIAYIGPLPEPGIWAATFQDRTNPERKAIAYFRATEEPPELSLGAALNILTFRSTSGLLNKPLDDPFKNGPETAK